MSGCRVIASKSFGKKYGLVLAEINEIYCANHVFGSSPVPGTFPSLSSNFRGSGLVVSWLEDQRCNLHYINQPIYFPSWLPDEARSAEFAIYLFAEDVSQSIYSLFDCGWGTWCRCCAILAIPSMTILIAEDEARSAELATQMRNPTFYNPFDCRGWGTKCRIRSGHTLFMLFFSYFPKPFCLSDLFPAYHLVTRMRKIYSLFSYI